MSILNKDIQKYNLELDDNKKFLTFKLDTLLLLSQNFFALAERFTLYSSNGTVEKFFMFLILMASNKNSSLLEGKSSARFQISLL